MLPFERNPQAFNPAHGFLVNWNNRPSPDYANNDGWFDDVSDGPVMAILKYYSEEDQEYRYLNVQAPAWVVVGIGLETAASAPSCPAQGASRRRRPLSNNTETAP